MKLPTRAPANIRVPSSAGVTGQIEREGQIKQQEFGLVMKAGGAVAQSVKQAAQDRANEESNSAYSKAKNSMNKFDEAHAQRDYYSADEIPDTIEVRKTEIVVGDDGLETEVLRERIPAYEIQAQLRRAHSTGSIQAAAADISDPKLRQDFLDRMNEQADSQHIKMLQSQKKAQTQQIRTQQDADFNKSLLERDYESAMYTAQNFNGSDEERRSRVDRVKYFNEFDTYNQAMSERNVPAMERALASLQNEDYSGNLKEVQRLSTIDQLESKISQVRKAKESKNSAVIATVGFEVDQTIKNMQSGKNVNPEEISRLASIMSEGMKSGAIKSDNAAWIRRSYEFQTLATMQGQLSEFRSMDAISRDNVIREMREKAGDWQANYKLDLFEAASRQVDQGLKDDSLEYASQTGVVELTPLQVTEGGFMSQQSLQQRVVAALASDENYGKATQTNLFTNSEIGDIVYALDNATDDEKLQMVSNLVHQGVGQEHANRIWSQFADQGAGGYAVLGDLIAEDEVKSAKTILSGQSAITNNPEIIKSWKGSIEPTMLSQLGNAFSASPETRKIVTDGIRDAYAGLALRDHDFSGELNQSRLDDAIRTVVGQTAVIGGNTIPMPKRNMHPDTFNLFLRDMDISYIRTLGGIDGYDSITKNGELKSKIMDGEIKLIPTGKNQYVLHENGKYLRRHDNKQPFILQYDENADQRSRWERGFERIVEQVGATF